MTAQRPLLEVGLSGPAPLRWSDIRRQVIEAQGGRCANEACRRVARLDVVRTTDGNHVGYCRRCRLLRDAGARHDKARDTWARGAQLRLSGTTRRARLVLLPAHALVEEALRELARCEVALDESARDGERRRAEATLPEDGAWALIRVLRRCGVSFADDDGREEQARAR